MRTLILMYHMVCETHDPREKRYCCSHRNFRRQMAYLKRAGYQIISLDDLVNFITSTNKTNQTSKTNQTNKTSETNQLVKPHKPVVITLDDGYMDNYENALQILKEYNFPATVFIVSSLVGKTNHWMRADGYAEKPLMGWREIEHMRKNSITIGSHTINHHRLTKLAFEDAKREIEDSKKFLEDKLGISISHFAYPYGDMNKSIVNMVREASYQTACSTRSGFNSENVSLLELRRLDIYGTDSILQFAIKLTYGTNDGNLLLPAKYYMKRFSEKINNLITQYKRI